MPVDITWVLGILLTALLAAFFGSLIPRKLKEREKFIEAAADFKNAFLPELTFLKHNTIVPEIERPYTTLDEFLKSAYIHRHLKAYEVFRNYLSSKNRDGIDKAWKDYCCDPYNQSILYFEQYSWLVANKGKDYEKQLKELALSRIEKILGFAKHR